MEPSAREASRAGHGELLVFIRGNIPLKRREGKSKKDFCEIIFVE
jgi:hypothetical protein